MHLTTELSLELRDILKRSKPHTVMLTIDEQMESICQQLKQQDVIVKGHLFHAHTIHHYTPLLLDVKQIEAGFFD